MNLKKYVMIEQNPMCQFGWRLLTNIHGNYSRLHVYFAKVFNGPTYKTIRK